ncbi:class I ribonucleotide reductase maintenance protein YfaE [Bowmanella dokdonensis]|uniref:2Fe-2S ferredoxin-like protein n=1 Tax=Bowmanella dokdonensis TaxID=751969 RepID=A0A939IQE4_9ALTE|nr:class I ribonucleotide reductase maintenance protein YfaE [Bowmanella dokdonensis]MBN7824507.1 2Fe-2S ferredoxin-like protein [Bowmanella dokdonensis]
MTQDDRFVIHLDEQTSLTCSKDKTLLESLEAQQVDVHYHCREGFCGACRTKLLEGEVEYVTDPLAFIDDDEILPCCCVPVSDLKIRLA